jgi:hypothetical protein
MPSLSPIVLKDVSATDHTFAPDTPVNGMFPFVRPGTSPIGDARITASLKKSAERAKADLSFAFPVLVNETVNGVTRPVVDRASYASLKFNFSAASTAAERADLVRFVANSLAETQTELQKLLVDLEGYY